MVFQINDNWLAAHSSYKCPKCDGTDLLYTIRIKTHLEQSSDSVVMDGATKPVKLPNAYVEIHPEAADLDLDERVECSDCLHESKGWDFIDLEHTRKLFKNMSKKRGKPNDSGEAVDYIKQHQTPGE